MNSGKRDVIYALLLKQETCLLHELEAPLMRIDALNPVAYEGLQDLPPDAVVQVWSCNG